MIRSICQTDCAHSSGCFFPWPNANKKRLQLMAQSVFAFDPAPGIDDPLEKCLEQQLGTGFFVLEPLQPVRRMFLEKLLKSCHEFVHVQPVVRGDGPGVYLIDDQHNRK